MAAVETTGWSPYISEAFDALGGLAASVKVLFTKKTPEEKAAAAAIEEQKRQQIVQAQLLASQQESSKLGAFLDWQYVKEFVIRWWWVALIILVFILRKPLMRLLNIKSNPGSRSKSAKARKRAKRSVTKSKTVKSGKKTVTKKKQRGGGLSVHGKRFSSMSAKMKYLRSLRKK